jgi:hypothetical protein
VKADSLRAVAVLADSLRRAATAAAKARADSLARVAAEGAARAHREQERAYRSGRWAAALGPSTLARRSPLEAEDALGFLGSSPRFYEQSGALEPVIFAGLPPGFTAGVGESGPLLPRLAIWDDAGLVADGGRLAWAWSALPPIAAPGLADSTRGGEVSAAADGPLAGRGRWSGEEAEPPGKSNVSSVWLTLGRPQASAQGFSLKARRRLLGLDGGASWGAWTRHHVELGELGPASSHGLSVGADVRARRWSIQLEHAAEDVAVSDFAGFEGEARGELRTWLRARWAGEGGAFAGLSAGRVEDRMRSSGPLIDPLSRVARDGSLAGWLGARLGEWRIGARGTWVGERLRDTLGAATYAPPDLNLWWGGAFAEGTALGGSLAAGLDVESAAGRQRLLPRLAWERPAERWRVFASAGAVSATALGEAERVLGENELPVVERPRGVIGQAGARFDSQPEADLGPASGTAAALAASILPAPPGSFAPGRLRLSLSLVGWSASHAVFPAFGLLARDILLGPAVTADVQGAALVGDVDWAPTRWARLGASGYGAGRSLPGGIAMAAPDYRLLVWAGPRLTLFAGSLELWLAGEADILGQRPAGDEVLPALVRPGARLALGLGDAWLVGRVTDLDGKQHPLPGRRFDGERLLSPGRVFRLYGEWRFLD